MAGQGSKQIQKLSPVAVNIFVGKGLETVYGGKVFGERRPDWEPPPLFVALTVDDIGTVTALDRNTGRIYQYDQDRNLLAAFGRLGPARGEFFVPVEVDVDSRGRLYVLDIGRDAIHVFHPTPFTEKVHQASALQSDGRYEEAAEAWEEVLAFASSYDLAHSGVGAAYYHEERWQDAMSEYSLARDQVGYSLAFYEHRQQVLRRNMGWLVACVLVTVAVVVLWPAVSRRRSAPVAPRLRSRSGERSTPAFVGVLLHPSETFQSLKEGRSLWPVVILVGLAALARLASLSLIAFHMRATPSAGSPLEWFRLYRPVAAYLLPELRWEDANPFLEALRILVPWLLWVAANYGVSALFEGEGTFRDVARTTAYCLVPYILFAVPIALLSHVMTGQERGLYESLWSVVYYWVLILLVVEIRVVHDYTVKRTLSVGAVMVFGVSVLAAGIVLVGLLSGQELSFLGEIGYEILQMFYR